MDQSVLFFSLVACIFIEILFLFNHRYLLKGCLFTAVSGIAGLAALQFLFPVIGLALTLPAMAVCTVFGIPGCIFLLLIRLICGI